MPAHRFRSLYWPLLAGLTLAGATEGRAQTPMQPAAPAVGYDWMDAPDQTDAGNDPDPWPRSDAADIGLDNMIHSERRSVEDAIAQLPGRAVTGGNPDARILRTLRKVGGDYIVLPLFTLHLDRPAKP